MPEPKTCTVRRVDVRPEPLLARRRYDDADSFEVRLREPDTHTAEEWARACLDGAAPVVLRLVRFVHARVARFALSTEPGSVLGWQTLSSTRDAFRIATQGPLLRAEIVARRTSPTAVSMTTFLFYEQRSAPWLWVVIGPLHRRVAPYLLSRAAARLSSAGSRGGRPHDRVPPGLSTA